MSVRKELPFDQVNRAAKDRYPDILFEWFPNGQKVDGGKEFAIGNLSGDAGGKDGGSVKVNIRSGKWAEMNGGEPNGGDALSLYAWAFCGGDRVKACKELGRKLGLYDGPLSKTANVVPFKPKNQPKAEEDDWRPMVPPPDGVPGPNVTGWDHVFFYRNRAGKLLRYVVRRDAKGDKPKKTLPLTYGYLKNEDFPDGKTDWHWKHPAAPRSLYGLERLDDNAWVLLQEGELKTDLVAPLLPELCCLSLTGGTGGKNCNDLEPLRGRYVICCPDADPGGRSAMEHIASQLLALGCTVLLVDQTGMRDKWDLGEAVKDGWTASQIDGWIHDRAHPFDPSEIDAEPDLGEPAEDGGDFCKDPEEFASDQEGVIPLGHDNGIFYYLSLGTGQVHGLTPARHVELEMIALADPVAYWDKIPMFQKEGGCNYKKAAAWMMRWGKRVGIFKPDRLRGRGAWLDIHRETGAARAVLNLGESLIVDGVEQHSMRLAGSSFIYGKAQSLGQAIAPPVSNAQAHELLKMCRLLRWEKTNSATLAAGFIVVSIICGVLPWRPSVWVTGGSNSGKTTFLRDIIAPICGRGTNDGIALNVQSKTTEAGLRQMLNSDARPVFFDEAEAEMLADKTRMQAVIDLNRQSSSEGGAEIIKGTQNQSGAKRYRIRSSFLYSSINIILDHQADESRITILDLYNPGPDELAEDRARWVALCGIMAATVADPMWCAGMVARSVWLMKTIIKNAQTFKLAVIERMGNSRAGDQLGTLLAGAYSLTSDREITLEEARAYLERPENDFSSATAIDAPKDEMRLTSRLIQQPIKVDLGDKVIERTVGQVIDDAVTSSEKVAPFFEAALKAVGIRLDGDGVWVSNTHRAIKDWLKDTPWSTGWGRALKRLPGAKSSDKVTVSFGKYDKTKAVWVPLKALSE